MTLKNWAGRGLVNLLVTCCKYVAYIHIIYYIDFNYTRIDIVYCNVLYTDTYKGVKRKST